MTNQKPPSPRAELSESGVPPPSSITADLDRKPVLYLPNGKVLVRQIGFRSE